MKAIKDYKTILVLIIQGQFAVVVLKLYLYSKKSANSKTLILAYRFITNHDVEVICVRNPVDQTAGARLSEIDFAFSAYRVDFIVRSCNS